MEEYCIVYYQRVDANFRVRKLCKMGEDYRYIVYTNWEVSLKMIKDIRHHRI